MPFETISLFENLENDQTMQRVASRRALALADTRVEKHLGAFLRGAQNLEEFEARLALVIDDFDHYVTSAAEEIGYPTPEHIRETILASYRQSDAQNPTCDGCGKSMNPVDKMVGGTCLSCAKKNAQNAQGVTSSTGERCPNCGKPGGCDHGPGEHETSHKMASQKCPLCDSKDTDPSEDGDGGYCNSCYSNYYKSDFSRDPDEDEEFAAERRQRAAAVEFAPVPEESEEDGDAAAEKTSAFKWSLDNFTAPGNPSSSASFPPNGTMMGAPAVTPPVPNSATMVNPQAGGAAAVPTVPQGMTNPNADINDVGAMSQGGVPLAANAQMPNMMQSPQVTGATRFSEEHYSPSDQDLDGDGASVLDALDKASEPDFKKKTSFDWKLAGPRTAGSGNTDLGGPEPKIDKSHGFADKPKPEDSGRWPTKEKDIVKPIKAENRDVDGKPNPGHQLTEIGEKTTETEDLPNNKGDAGFDNGGVNKGPHTKTFDGKGQVDPVTKPVFPDKSVVEAAFRSLSASCGCADGQACAQCGVYSSEKHGYVPKKSISDKDRSEATKAFDSL